MGSVKWAAVCGRGRRCVERRWELGVNVLFFVCIFIGLNMCEVIGRRGVCREWEVRH